MYHPAPHHENEDEYRDGYVSPIDGTVYPALMPAEDIARHEWARSAAEAIRQGVDVPITAQEDYDAIAEALQNHCCGVNLARNEHAPSCENAPDGQDYEEDDEPPFDRDEPDYEEDEPWLPFSDDA